MGKTMKKNKLFVISGPSGVGKNTLLNNFLAERPDFIFSVSYTTRAPRGGEIEGVNYFFVKKEEFQRCIKNDEFLEWAEFNENYYGTKKSFVEKTLAKEMNMILEIDTQGALQIKKKVKDAILIFIMPPSLEDLEKRLRGRNTEDEETIKKRLAFAESEIKRAKKFNYKVVNDSLDNALRSFKEVVNKELA